MAMYTALVCFLIPPKKMPGDVNRTKLGGWVGGQMAGSDGQRSLVVSSKEANGS